MPFKAGQSGNPSGRPRGAKDKIARPTKQRLADFLAEDFDLAVKDWAKLTPADRWQRRPALYEFILPKLARNATFDLGSMTDEQVEAALDYSLLSDDALREIIAAGEASQKKANGHG
jgi:hypothetical protein